MYHTLNKIIDIMSKVLINVGMTFMGIATLLVFFQTVSRYIFSVSYPWIEEVMRYLVIVVSFALCGHVMYHNGHISLSIIYDNIKSDKFKKILDIINAVLNAIFGAIFFYLSVNVFIDAVGKRTMSQIFPMRLPYSFLPIGMCLLVLYGLLKAIILMMELSGATGSDPVAEVEDVGLVEMVESIEEKVEETIKETVEETTKDQDSSDSIK